MAPLGLRGKRAAPRRLPEISNQFTDAVQRDNLTPKPTKGDNSAQFQPHGNKVAPTATVAEANATATATGGDNDGGDKAKQIGTVQKKAKKKKPASAGAKRTSTKASGEADAPKIGSSADQESTAAPTPTPAATARPSTAPAGGIRLGLMDDPNEEANGDYGVFIQTRRCEELCSGLGLTMADIRKMKRKYDANDMYNSGEITQAEFFFIINEERRPLTLGIFTFADVPVTQKFLSFDEFLLCVVSFATLTKPELFQYVFDLYDDDKSGALDEREFSKMSRELQSKQFCFPRNVDMAIKMLEGKEGRGAVMPDDGLVDLGEFMKFARNFPVAFFPIVNMQKNVRATTLGEARWSRITANKLKTLELLAHMRRNLGAVPELTVRERAVSVFSGELFHIRKRAGELYARELAQRRLLGTDEVVDE